MTKTMRSIESLMRENVVTASTDEPVIEAARKMDEKNVGSVVVLDDQKPVGMVTDRDQTVNVLSRRKNPDETTVEEVMSEDLFRVHVDDPIFDVISRACEAGVRRIPVVSGDRLIGIVTHDDLFLHLVNELQKMSRVIFWESQAVQDA